MEWFTAKQIEQLRINERPQIISVMAEVADLYSQIPTAPELVPPSLGPPTVVHQWYGRIKSRPVQIEVPVFESASMAEAIGDKSVLLYTSFVENSDRGDWGVLLELEGLPAGIYLRRPFFIENRKRESNAVVYRPDPRGWREPVYSASSQAEAEKLLAYIQQDPWNAACHVDKPDPTGEWTILRQVRPSEIAVGCYAAKSSALRVACDMSRKVTDSFLVKELSGVDPHAAYRISDGRVVSE